MGMHIHNITLFPHWNVNSLRAVRNEAIWEFPYWLYYHFTQRIDCVSLKAAADRTITRRKIRRMRSAALGSDRPGNLTSSPVPFLPLAWGERRFTPCYAVLRRSSGRSGSGGESVTASQLKPTHVNHGSCSQITGLLTGPFSSNLIIFFKHGLWWLGEVKFPQRIPTQQYEGSWEAAAEPRPTLSLTGYPHVSNLNPPGNTARTGLQRKFHLKKASEINSGLIF